MRPAGEGSEKREEAKATERDPLGPRKGHTETFQLRSGILRGQEEEERGGPGKYAATNYAGTYTRVYCIRLACYLPTCTVEHMVF